MTRAQSVAFRAFGIAALLAAAVAGRFVYMNLFTTTYDKEPGAWFLVAPTALSIPILLIVGIFLTIKGLGKVGS